MEGYIRKTERESQSVNVSVHLLVLCATTSGAMYRRVPVCPLCAICRCKVNRWYGCHCLQRKKRMICTASAQKKITSTTCVRSSSDIFFDMPKSASFRVLRSLVSIILAETRARQISNVTKRSLNFHLFHKGSPGFKSRCMMIGLRLCR